MTDNLHEPLDKVGITEADRRAARERLAFAAASVCIVTRGTHRWAIVQRKAPMESRTECQGCGALQAPRDPMTTGAQ